MLSIIICSRKSKPDKLLLTNIEATIGVEFELIYIDNSDKYWIKFGEI